MDEVIKSSGRQRTKEEKVALGLWNVEDSKGF